MMQLTAVVALFSDLREAELTAWIERGWVRPEANQTARGGQPVFQEIDVARVRLIYDLRTAMHIEDETIPLILSLLDQVHDLRAGMRAVMRAVEAQPEAVREAILAALD